MDAAMADRAAGVLLGQACGDALGVPYEFGPPLADNFQPEMVGGGPFGFAPGEYSDDTAMAVCIAEVASTGADLTSTDSLDQIASNFLRWAQTSKDVGAQTRQVFSRVTAFGGKAGAAMRSAAKAYAFENPGRVGNGALMRTSIVALTRLQDREATAAAARAVASLTHADPLGQESCVLWSEAIRVAVTTGKLDLVSGLDLVSRTRREQWRAWIAEATDVDPRSFPRNGFAVHALQAAWAAITWTPIPDLDCELGSCPARHFELALCNAVRSGDDTDTVAAIAGGLLGALWGQSAIPYFWQRKVHGYGGHRAHGLISLTVLTATAGALDARGWPQVSRMEYEPVVELVRVPHPHDSGVVLGSFQTLKDHGCDAVVSLCRIGEGDRLDAGALGADHVEIRLLDSEVADENPHLEFVISDASGAIKSFRQEGMTVFLHCVMAHHRTPAVAVAYARLLGIETREAQASVLSALPSASGRGRLWDAATR